MTGAWIVPVRDVQATSGTQANCGGIAAAVADFEPWPEFAFVRRLDPGATAGGDAELIDFCSRCVEEGVRAALTELTGGTLPPVRVVLRTILAHPVDSNAARNREAGRLLAIQAVRLAAAQSGPAETG